MLTTYMQRAPTIDASIVFDRIALERVRYRGYRAESGDHEFAVSVGHVIEGKVVARAAIPALMDDTTFFMAGGRAEETVASYVEWITRCWENNGRKLTALIAMTELAPLRVWPMPD